MSGLRGLITMLTLPESGVYLIALDTRLSIISLTINTSVLILVLPLPFTDIVRLIDLLLAIRERSLATSWAIFSMFNIFGVTAIVPLSIRVIFRSVLISSFIRFEAP